MKKRLLCAGLAAAMAVSLTACGGSAAGTKAEGSSASAEAKSEGGSEAAKVFKIGGIGPVTGGAAVYGMAVQHGTELAVNEINAAGGILVDGLGVGDVGNIVLRDRQNLAQNGIIVVVLTLEKHSNQLLSGPDIVSRGFVYVRESEDLLEEAHNIVANAVEDCLDRRVSDWGKIKNIIKDSLSEFLWKRMKRNPMILPIIMEV